MLGRIATLLTGCLAVAAGGQVRSSTEALYKAFLKPPERYAPMPIWYWNGELRGEEAKRQIDVYIAQGAQGAVVYPAIGLKTRFLGDEFWKVWSDILPYARTKGFRLGWMPDFNHPQGDARDVWMNPPEQSRVMEGHPEFRLKRLTFTRRAFLGPGRAAFAGLANPVIAVAAIAGAGESIVAETLTDVSSGLSGTIFEINLGPGRWLLFFYSVVNSEGTKGRTRVDQLNPDATRRYVDLTLGEFERRFPDHVGNTLTLVMLDHEGSYGGPIVWSPLFWETFRKIKGYDFRKYLPVLVHDAGQATPRIRMDYFDVVTHMFVENFWRPIAQWGKKRNVQVIGQSWGDWLQLDPEYGGDYLRMQRAMSMPFTEEEEASPGIRHRDPRGFREPASIAHFEGTPFACECLLVQGARTFPSPQKMRIGTNSIATFGVNLWMQNTSYDEVNAEWPPQMGSSQPHFKFFHHYSNLVRRLSFMNDGGRHASEVALFRPIASVVAATTDTFDNERGSRRAGMAEEGDGPVDPVRLQAFSRKVEHDYDSLMNLFVDRHRDHDVLDDHYLQSAAVENGKLVLAGEKFSAIVLPTMNVISRTSMAKVRKFYESGGIIIAYGRLPSGSTDNGWKDDRIAADVRAVFGAGKSPNSAGGRAVFVEHDVERVADELDEILPADLRLEQGDRGELLYSHRVKDGHDVYWIVNDRPGQRRAVLSVKVQGSPELWDPTEGTRRPAASWRQDGRTFVYVDFEPWSGLYLVFPPAAARRDLKVARTNLRRVAWDGTRVSGIAGAAPVYVEGEFRGQPFNIAKPASAAAAAQLLPADGWTLTPRANVVRVNYARQLVTAESDPEATGFADPMYNDSGWQNVWLSKERWTIREWNVIGPFPNPDHAGFNEQYPPEREIAFEKAYTGLNGAVTWKKLRSRTPEIRFSEALGVPDGEGIRYALTYVHSPRDMTAEAVLSAYNAKLFVNGEQALSFHPMPRYYEFRDGFAFRGPVHLRAGWNEVLVKVEHDAMGGASVFYLRLANADGLPVADVRSAARPAVTEIESAATGWRWYRIPVPPGTVAFRVPRRLSGPRIYLNGKSVEPAAAKVSLAGLEWNSPNVLAIRVPATEELLDYAEFDPGTTPCKLGSWTGTGLSYFSGEAVYEASFELAPHLIGRGVELDLGEVGLTAEVWVNGKKAGERVWAPFRLDVGPLLVKGTNRLRIAVTNSDANARAFATEERFQERTRPPVGGVTNAAAAYLDSLRLNGLIGPVRLSLAEPIGFVLEKEVSAR